MPTHHQYPKVDAMSLVAQDLNAMVGEIHQELQDELKTDIELGEMAKQVLPNAINLDHSSTNGNIHL